MKRYKILYQTGALAGQESIITSAFYYVEGQIVFLNKERIRILVCY